MAYTIVVDTGGTFTDLVLASEERLLGLFKAVTVPQDVFTGIQAALRLAAESESVTIEDLLRHTQHFVYATTHATNAVLEGTTARTAFLSTEGHPDILLYREGGKSQPLNIAKPYPEPYVPRSLSFEIRERVLSDGSILVPLDEEQVCRVIERLAELRVEAVGVCLLWSAVNPVHEERVGALLCEQLPKVPHTLSHRINGVNREYRRASSAVIDASLKPIMRAHLEDMERRIRDLGFAGEPLMVTHTSGGVQSLADICEQPLYSVDSGPALAPVAARSYSGCEPEWKGRDLIVLDAGGTSCDVSLVRAGTVTVARDKWLGPRFEGHMTGLPAVDTRSVGAGGGSIARVDSGGMLRVGPESAGSIPGPACYARGGAQATVTDAAMVLGTLDPAFFLGGRMPLDPLLAERAIREAVADPLGLDVESAAASILAVYTERIRAFLSEVMLSHGLDPRETLLVAGGGSAGLNIVDVARELAAPAVLLPTLAAGLSAVGGQYSDLTASFSRGVYATTESFPIDAVNRALREIAAEMDAFLARAGTNVGTQREFFCEARYANQLWELDVALGELAEFESQDDITRLRDAFDAVHQSLFSVSQRSERVEILGWRGQARAIRRKPALEAWGEEHRGAVEPTLRSAWFGMERLAARVYSASTLAPGQSIEGPAIIEETTTTLVLPPGACAKRRAAHYWIEIDSTGA